MLFWKKDKKETNVQPKPIEPEVEKESIVTLTAGDDLFTRGKNLLAIAGIGYNDSGLYRAIAEGLYTYQRLDENRRKNDATTEKP